MSKLDRLMHEYKVVLNDIVALNDLKDSLDHLGKYRSIKLDDSVLLDVMIHDSVLDLADIIHDMQSEKELKIRFG